MLDALLAEARLRWGLDPAGGPRRRRRGAPRRDPDRAVRPAAGRAGLAPAREPCRSRAPRAPLPGRHGATPSTGSRVLRRLYPADHQVGRFGQPDATTVGALTAADLAQPCTWARSRRSRTSPRRGGCPGSPPASGSPTAAPGIGSRPTSRCETTSSRRRTRSTTRSRAVRPPSSPASSATSSSRSCSTHSWPPRKACST